MATTGATVPVAAPLLTRAGIYTQRAVRGGSPQWGGLVEAANHLAGRGRVLVPLTIVTLGNLTTSAETLRFKVWPSYQATKRVYCLTYAVKGAGSGRVLFTDNNGASSTQSYGAVGTFRQFHTEAGGTLGSSVTDLAPSVALDTGSTGSVELQTIQCWEVPRPDLAIDASELGVDLSSVNRGRFVGGTTGKGPEGLAAALDAYETATWRSGLFQWARGSTNRLSTKSGSLSPVFLAPFPLLGTKRYRTSTTRTVDVYVRCAAGATTTGEVKFSMTSGATLTLTITSGMASGWLSGTLAIDCDDLSASDGRRSSRDDKCTVEWRRTGGANSVYLESISIGNG